jgi:hypothetical protein
MPFEDAEITLCAGNGDHIDLFRTNKALRGYEFKLQCHVFIFRNPPSLDGRGYGDLAAICPVGVGEGGAALNSNRKFTHTQLRRTTYTIASAASLRNPLPIRQRGTSLRRFCSQCLAFFDGFIDSANHVEGIFGQVIIFAFDDGLE